MGYDIALMDIASLEKSVSQILSDLQDNGDSLGIAKTSN